MTAPETPLPSPPGMNITDKNKLKGSLFIEAYGSLIDGISKDAESETEKALDITFNAIGAASATVMLAIDPLGSLIGAGIGWLIEHVSFLRDALNQLMGNPEEIQANVEANKAKAVELRQLAEDHKSGLATFDGWSGQSSERFKTSMDGMSQELDDLANAVESKAKIVAIMGMLVTVLRDIVRDMIAQLLGSLIGGALLAAAAMIPTFGASIPIFIGFATGKAVALGVNIASRVARVVAALGRQMKRIGDLDDIMAKVSKGWSRFENGADVAEIAYEGYKAQNEVDKAVDKVTPGGGGAGGGGGTATASAPNVVANAHVGTVQKDAALPMQTASHTQMDAVQPLQPFKTARQMDATEPAQPFKTARRMDAAEPAQPFKTAHQMDATEPAQPFKTARHMDAVQPLQPMHAAARVDAVAPLQPMHTASRMEALEPMQPLQRMSAVEAPMAPVRVEATPMYEGVARTASDSTMVSGVSMTTPVHEAVQPMQAREMYTSSEAEPLQPTSSFEPMARTQMAHTFEVLEPTNEGSNPLLARTAYSSVEATPFEAVTPFESAQAYDTSAQSGSAPVRPAVAHERPTRPSGQ